MVVEPTSTTEETPKAKATRWLESFSSALDAQDLDTVTGLFTDECFWRDLVAFTWNIITLEGKTAIRDMLSATLSHVCPTNWVIQGDVMEVDGHCEAWLAFDTETARGKGYLRLSGDKCVTLLTTSEYLKGHEEPHGPTRQEGAEHAAYIGRKAWIEQRELQRASLGHSQQPYVVIVGGGQAGIILGARLRRLGVPFVILERNPRAGDSWRRRYKSLCLHDPVWYDHLPYLPFPDHWPVYSPKDRMADWLEAYVRIMDLDYWTSATCVHAAYNSDAQVWAVDADRDGEKMTLRPTHLVLATGVSGMPNVPDVSGLSSFQGDIWHSSKHPGGAAYADKRAVIIGSNNSAHDIATDLWENRAQVTMVQRSSTLVARVDSVTDMVIAPLYSERAVARGITTDIADFIFASIPYRVMPQGQKKTFDAMRQHDGEFYDRLRKVGFQLDFGVDDSGLFTKYCRRGSGYYIDTGGSDLIIKGLVKLVQGQLSHITADALVLEDGTELKADLIVFATGYGNMNQWAAKLISNEVAEKVGRVWGLGSDTPKDPGPWEGELRNMWKPTQQQGLWFHGGNLHQSRHYSQFLALQLKARYERIDTPVYGLQKVHHKW